MKTLSRWMLALIAVAALATLVAGCSHEEDADEAEAFSFVVYPGSRYLAQLTELTKQAHKVLKPSEEPPPVAVYDTDASVEDVANFYAKSYGYPTNAQDATKNHSPANPTPPRPPGA